MSKENRFWFDSAEKHKSFCLQYIKGKVKFRGCKNSSLVNAGVRLVLSLLFWSTCTRSGEISTRILLLPFVEFWSYRSPPPAEPVQKCKYLVCGATLAIHIPVLKILFWICDTFVDHRTKKKLKLQFLPSFGA